MVCAGTIHVLFIHSKVETKAKTNEQVQADLETQRDILNQARAECKKLESSAVMPSMFFFLPYLLISGVGSC
jgi:hypothetical protein